MGSRLTVGDVPTISASSYTSSTVPVSDIYINPGTGGQVFIGESPTGVAWMPETTGGDLWHNLKRQAHQYDAVKNLQQVVTQTAIKQKDQKMARRIVQVFIADTDENVPLEKSVIYTGEQKLTDATDQELFFEINIKDILDKHNSYRVTLVNKKVKERTENLEPVKIRDLKMVVVNVATF